MTLTSDAGAPWGTDDRRNVDPLTRRSRTESETLNRRASSGRSSARRGCLLVPYACHPSCRRRGEWWKEWTRNGSDSKRWGKEIGRGVNEGSRRVRRRGRIGNRDQRREGARRKNGGVDGKARRDDRGRRGPKPAPLMLRAAVVGGGLIPAMFVLRALAAGLSIRGARFPPDARHRRREGAGEHDEQAERDASHLHVVYPRARTVKCAVRS